MGLNEMQSSTVDEYIASAIKHGAATMAGDYKSANKAHSSLMDALEQLRALPDRGEEALSSLLAHPNSSVVCWAATHLLPIKEKEAKQTLQRLESTEAGIVGFDAKMVLQEWESGRLSIP